MDDSLREFLDAMEAERESVGATGGAPAGSAFLGALGRMTSEAAYAPAVRHLAEMGYSTEEIREQLLYPATHEQIEEVLRESRKKAESGESEYVYVKDTDKYGKPTFRRVRKSGADK